MAIELFGDPMHERTYWRDDGAGPEPSGARPRVTRAPVVVRRSAPVVVQARLRVGAASDPLEVEADRVADEVVSAVGPLGVLTPATAISNTRIARSPTGPLVGPEGGSVGGRVERAVRSAAGGRPLEQGVRNRMEQAFGTDFGQVRIHQNSALAPELGAVAFTQGTRIHFASGAYAPGSRTGTNLLAHELTHVVQQTGSAVRRAPVPAATRIRARPGAPWVIRPRRTLHGVSVEDTKADAVSQHAADRKALMAAVDAGATQTSDEVLRNACQWIREATNADVLRIYALTPTHDSDVRAQALTNDPGTIRLAYFGRDAQGNNGALYPLTARQPVADYDEGNTSDPRVRDFARTSAALIGDSVIVFLSPGTRDREEIYQTIRHEVQHKADFNEATGGLTQAEALETYRTEFRAHWVERRPAFEQSDSTEDDLPGRLLENQGTPEASKYDGWNQRQMLIFDSIYSHPSYAVVKRYWDPATNPDAGPRAAFQQAIFNIKRLDSPNPRNSLRVQKFFVALGALTAQTNVGDAAVTAIGTMIDSAPFTRQDALDIQAAGKYRTLAASARANAGPVSAAVLNHIDGLLSDKASFLPTSFARFARGLF